MNCKNHQKPRKTSFLTSLCWIFQPRTLRVVTYQLTPFGMSSFIECRSTSDQRIELLTRFRIEMTVGVESKRDPSGSFRYLELSCLMRFPSHEGDFSAEPLKWTKLHECVYILNN